ncbi:hypothetical protein SERLADRAFT_396828 [Serpula lacrymans var. lacrymans S7.9]|uniref:FAS1 domain-containing protein n=1 Tax=Serpula lacrymans var. lacrymans (strain S7.9) TaxID=578457 RepID=F8P4Y0_SERL9|nr:uncharacterized protein SERLADRAFT_396828 [Serpula lacrymans var. lacrymans S7.9]EGO21667.1 hypothetical protein SERLADRAFT_396828 [Serpula lacrymans var. lacrymans S7.9]
MRLHLLTPLFFAASALALPDPLLYARKTCGSWFSPQDGHQVALGTKQTLAEEKTIYQTLKDDENFSRLVKAIDLSDRVVSLLDDSTAGITFFAVPNKGLPRPRRPRHDEIAGNVATDDGVARNLGELVLQVEELESSPLDDDEKEHRKKVIARIVRGILAYHILPEKTPYPKLLEYSTFQTNLTLKDGSLDYEPLRISVQSRNTPPRVQVNIVSEIIRPDVAAKNGVIHVITLPLLPPPSVFQELFLVPSAFSFVTSALQRVGLTGALERRYTPGHGDKEGVVEGNPALTFFAPTSKSFERLPKKLQFYLFSPFGERALKKILQYHIVLNYVHNATSEKDVSGLLAEMLEEHPEIDMDTCGAWGDLFEHADGYVNPDGISRRSEMDSGLHAPPPLPHKPAPVYSYETKLPTFLEDHPIHVKIEKYKINIPIPGPPRFFTKFHVNGQHVGLSDLVARNGAVHVIGKLLVPRRHKDRDGKPHPDAHEDKQWEDWEDWLPKWAMEE